MLDRSRYRQEEPESAGALLRPAEPGAGRADVLPLMPRDGLEQKLQDIWVRILRIPPMGVREDFFELGGDSLQMVELGARIEEAFGVALRSIVFLEQRTIEGQANAFLRNPPGSNEWTSLVCVQPQGSRPAIFFPHTHGGTAAYCLKFPPYLGLDQPIYGLQSQALSGGAPHSSIVAMATHYLREMRSVQPEGPYYLFGYCSAGIVAFEIAQQLVRQGQQVGFLGMFNTPAPGSLRLGLPGKLSYLLKKAKTEIRKLRFIRGGEKITHLWRKTRNLERLVAGELKSELSRRLPGRFAGSRADGLEARALEICYINSSALKDYRSLEPFPGKITFFNSRDFDHGYSIPPIDGWNAATSGGVEVLELRRTDSPEFDENHLEAIAQRLREAVRSR